MNFFIYSITNLTNYKVYVGQTVDPKTRLVNHRAVAKSGARDYPLYRSIRKHGFDNFQFAILEVCSSEQEADAAEIKWIELFDSRNSKSGYNLAEGGSVARGWHHSEEFKRMMSETLTGKIVSEESRALMSAAMQERLAAGWRPSHSEETKKKMSASHTGKKSPHSEEWRQHMSNVMKGRGSKLSEQQTREIQRSPLSTKELASIYGVGKTTIRKARKSK